MSCLLATMSLLPFMLYSSCAGWAPRRVLSGLLSREAKGSRVALTICSLRALPAAGSLHFARQFSTAGQPWQLGRLRGASPIVSVCRDGTNLSCG